MTFSSWCFPTTPHLVANMNKLPSPEEQARELLPRIAGETAGWCCGAARHASDKTCCEIGHDIWLERTAKAIRARDEAVRRGALEDAEQQCLRLADEARGFIMGWSTASALTCAEYIRGLLAEQPQGGGKP